MQIIIAMIGKITEMGESTEQSNIPKKGERGGYNYTPPTNKSIYRVSKLKKNITLLIFYR